MTLREEILKDSGVVTEGARPHLTDIFNRLFQDAVNASGKDYNDFLGSEEYKKWVEEKIQPLIKKNSAKKIFDKWENDLLYDMD